MQCVFEIARNLIVDNLRNSSRPLMTTSFGEYSAVLLHMVYTIKPVPVVWVDTGFNTEQTMQHKEKMTRLLNLDLHIVRNEPWDKEIPSPNSNNFDKFKQHVKVEPFKNKMAELQPTHWFSSIRREETRYREYLNYTEVHFNVIKVSPLLEWTEHELNSYIKTYDLPNYNDYYDPTKKDPDCECGIHTTRLE